MAYIFVKCSLLVNNSKFQVNNLVEVMGWKAVGERLTQYSKSIEMGWEKKVDQETAQPELF